MRFQTCYTAPMSIILSVPIASDPLALERFVSEHLNMPYLTVRSWVLSGHITVNGELRKPQRYVHPGDTIHISPPPLQTHPATPEDLGLDVVYQDADLVIVNKPTGMATHPSAGWWHGSCINGLLYAIRDWPGIGQVAGPGVVHRLDRDTSGLLVFAKSEAAHQALLAAARERKIARRYLAWVTGALTGAGTITAPLGRDPENPYQEAVRPDGKAAITHYKVLATTPERSLVGLQLETGRTHQIRVHMAHVGHPVWGDPLYGQAQATGMTLHAASLAFVHPIRGEPLHFQVVPPPPWEAFAPLGNEVLAELALNFS
jgi:23S rRNA pseudouridine1911/1915/1917 synthase